MRKIVSFSLYGNDPIYTIGCIKNAEIKNKIMEDWEMWVYHDESVNQEILSTLKSHNVFLIKSHLGNHLGRMWRFLPASSDVDFFISRDTDSRLSLRDVESTDEWIKSGKNFHIVREHPVGHHWWINAGMWGCKGGSVKDIEKLINEYYVNTTKKGDKFVDQYFLEDIIYPIAKKDVLIHDEFCNMEQVGIPIKRDRILDDFAFIGESVDENDIPRGDQRTPIKNLYTMKKSGH
jgi:protein O-GlcNAc transferase